MLNAALPDIMQLGDHRPVEMGHPGHPHPGHPGHPHPGHPGHPHPGHPGHVVLPIVPNLPAAPTLSYTTIPSNGDLNPYGVAVVPYGFPKGGLIRAGDILVSNYNSSGNLQGTGTTIVKITPGQPNSGPATVFSTSSSTGMSMALGVLRNGFVIVGNVPTTNGTFGTIGSGSLQVLDKNGNLVQTISDPALLDGPWGMSVSTHGVNVQLFVANVVSGTVTRIDLKVTHHHGQAGIDVKSMTQIGSGYTVAPNAAALVLGPGGVAYNPHNDVLYVASSSNNAIYAIAHAGRIRFDNGTGRVVYQDPAHLRGPIGLVIAPNGDLLTTNGDAVNGDPNFPSELIEFTPRGQFVGQLSLDPAQGGAFGLTVEGNPHFVDVITVDDNNSTLNFRMAAITG